MDYGTSSSTIKTDGMVTLRAIMWLSAAALTRPAASVVGTYLELVGTVINIILMGQKVHSRANGRAVSQGAAADQGEAYAERAPRAYLRGPRLTP